VLYDRRRFHLPEGRWRTIVFRTHLPSFLSVMANRALCPTLPGRFAAARIALTGIFFPCGTPKSEWSAPGCLIADLMKYLPATSNHPFHVLGRHVAATESLSLGLHHLFACSRWGWTSPELDGSSHTPVFEKVRPILTRGQPRRLPYRSYRNLHLRCTSLRTFLVPSLQLVTCQ
jgi:hypothetical protein